MNTEYTYEDYASMDYYIGDNCIYNFVYDKSKGKITQYSFNGNLRTKPDGKNTFLIDIRYSPEFWGTDTEEIYEPNDGEFNKLIDTMRDTFEAKHY